ncbi:HYR domain-containing protein [Chloroflexota bacterium]
MIHKLKASRVTRWMNLILVFIMAAMINPLPAAADEVVLRPAYITGTVQMGTANITSLSVYANWSDQSSSTSISVNPNSPIANYELTVNVPEGTSPTYSVYTYAYFAGDLNRIRFGTQSVQVTEFQTSTANFGTANPATITGTIQMGTNTITRVNLQVYSSGNRETSMYIRPNDTTSLVTYTMPVDVPAGSSLDYTFRYYGTNAYFNNQSSYVYFNYNSSYPTTVTVPSGASVTQNLGTANPGQIEGTLTHVGVSMDYARIWTQDTPTVHSYSLAIVDSLGNYRMPVMPSDNRSVAGYTYLVGGTRINIPSQDTNPSTQTYVAVGPGETITQDWTITPAFGAIAGDFTLNGSVPIYRHRVYASGPTSGSVYLNNNGTYNLTDRVAGSYTVSAYSYFDSARNTYLYYPYGALSPGRSVTVSPGVTTNVDIVADQAILEGTITLVGTRTLADTCTESWDDMYVYAYGIYQTDTYGGSFQYEVDKADAVDTETVTYQMVLTEGPWKLRPFSSYYGIHFYNPDPDEYLNSQMRYFYDRELYSENISVTAGQTTTRNLTYATGDVTVTFRVAGGGVLSSPQLQGNCEMRDESNRLVWDYQINASSNQQNVETGNVTFVGFEGTATLTPRAQVLGDWVTFSPITVDVIPGAVVIIDLGAPALNVDFPDPGYITSDSSITVNGTAVDEESAVASVTVNGVAADLTPTGPTENPYQSVEFSTTISLEQGANQIVTVAADTADPANEASDTRTVYRDDGPPSLSWTPADGTVTSLYEVTVNGTATDDNGIKSITVGSVEVPFESTGNPEDPNEVSFSKNVTLQDGANPITVVATDICGRPTSETHTVTVSMTQNQPPVANAGQYQPVEQDTLGGASVILDGSASFDPDEDPLSYNWTWPGGNATIVNPTVTLPLGTTTVTLVVNDGTVDSTPDTVDITVKDSTAPSITGLANVTGVEQVSANGTAVDLNSPTVSDICDTNPVVTNDAPVVFPLGTTAVTWTATDASGNSANATQTVTVVDTTAPTLTVTPSTTTLWPPNHKYVTVTIETTASDICDTDVSNNVLLVSVTSDEPEDVAGKNNKQDGGDGNTLEDIVIVDKNTVELRAERLGGSDGRVYTLNYSVTDASGNTSTASVKVIVEHNPGEPVVDSGVQYTVTP